MSGRPTLARGSVSKTFKITVRFRASVQLASPCAALTGLAVYPSRRHSEAGSVVGLLDKKEGHHNALVAQRIEHLTTDQKVGGSNPF